MRSENLSPDEELAALRARRRRSRLRGGAVAAALGLAAAAAWWASRPAPDPPERVLFARTLPSWSVERLNGRPGTAERERVLQEASRWPALRAALGSLVDAWDGERAGFLATVAAANRAAREAGLAYWVDAPFSSGKQWVLTYEVLGRARWALADGSRSVEVARVRRLDRVNLELAFLGHAGGDQPVVLQDRVEAELLDVVHAAYAQQERTGVGEGAARGAWRSAMQDVAGAAALAEAARLLDERAQKVARLSKGPRGGVSLDLPERMELGDELLDSLLPYADVGRRGGPALLAADVRAVREADRALRRGEPRQALERVLEQMVLDTEAHEARHALETMPEGPPPPALLEAVGDDDERFARLAARELVAYVGQLHASERPCAVLAQLAFRARGDRARATPHFYASHVLLRSLSGRPEEPLTSGQLEEDLLANCRAPREEIRARTAAAHAAILGTPFVAATRTVVESTAD